MLRTVYVSGPDAESTAPLLSFKESTTTMEFVISLIELNIGFNLLKQRIRDSGFPDTLLSAAGDKLVENVKASPARREQVKKKKKEVSVV